MPDPRDPNLIDGFTSIRAARRAAGRDPSASPDAETTGSFGRIVQTAVPTRHDIVCYACGYRHPTQGVIRSAYCPRCKTDLDVRDYPVDGEWSGTLKTLGTVEISAGALVREGSIFARVVTIRGDASRATVEGYECVEVHGTARFDPTRVRTPRYVLRGGGTVTACAPMECEDVDIEGALEADVVAAGTVTLRAGGLLRGSVRAEHLVVEEGGGLIADVVVRPTQRGPAAPQEAT